MRATGVAVLRSEPDR